MKEPEWFKRLDENTLEMVKFYHALQFDIRRTLLKYCHDRVEQVREEDLQMEAMAYSMICMVGVAGEQLDLAAIQISDEDRSDFSRGYAHGEASVARRVITEAYEHLVTGGILRQEEKLQGRMGKPLQDIIDHHTEIQRNYWAWLKTPEGQEY